MSTLYDLFKVNENASTDEIKKAFDEIIEELSLLPQDGETVNHIRRLKIAYSILSNPEKRKNYDLDLAEKRANELIKKIEIKNTEDVESYEDNKKINQQSKVYKAKEISDKIKNEKNSYSKNIIVKNEKESPEINENQPEDLKKQEREEARRLKEQKKQYKKEKKLERKEMLQKREMEIQAYGKYLEQQGYKVKYPWTLSRIKRLLFSIFLISICLIIVWNIPPVNEYLKKLYNENIIIQKNVDIFFSIFEILNNIIKGIFIKS